MEEPPDLYTLETVEQMRALADPLRIRIVAELARRPLTATQVGERVGVAANKAHYHVRELERVGLVRLVEKRERGGILEKYFRAVARSISFTTALFGSVSPDERIAAASGALEVVVAHFLQSLAESISDPEGPARTALIGANAWLTDVQFKEVAEQLQSLLSPYSRRPADPAARERTVYHILYTTDPNLAPPPPPPDSKPET